VAHDAAVRAWLSPSSRGFQPALASDAARAEVWPGRALISRAGGLARECGSARPGPERRPSCTPDGLDGHTKGGAHFGVRRRKTSLLLSGHG
jgi:hypothetical protein